MINCVHARNLTPLIQALAMSAPVRPAFLARRFTQRRGQARVARTDRLPNQRQARFPVQPRQATWVSKFLRCGTQRACWPGP
ncbi:hypothetical protein CBM2586_A110008 [Cupriavidus phytorum]|uniref:Uncharacterized protein n=1 Tax=Cupriavidus taiwanensis TaxID=164546 RepID=A0A375BZU7_9BURK|nr:hypothetical protein CBM2586_A110008 [Cupriavidus taiwanensis]